MGFTAHILVPSSCLTADTECDRRMTRNDSKSILASNVSVQYRNNTAFVSWAPPKGESQRLIKYSFVPQN